MSIGENVGEHVGETTGGSGSSRFLAQPTNLTFVSSTSTTITYSFTAPPQGAAIEYRLKRLAVILATTSYGVTTITATGLTPDTSYAVGLVTTDGVNESVISNEVIASTAVASSGWTIASDYDSGTPGDAVTNDPCLNTLATAGTVNEATYSTDFARTGTQSMKMHEQAGTDTWGGFASFPSLLHEGDEVWIRAYLYIPPTFNFSAPGGIGLKTMRTHVRKQGGGDGSNNGYLDALTGASNMVMWNEVSPSSGTFPCFSDFGNYWDNILGTGVGTHCAPPVGSNITGAWQAVEQYVKFSSSLDTGIYRFWQNGVLLFEDTHNLTMKASTDESDVFHLFSFHNGTAQATQDAYVDDVIITNETPSNTDASGNPFIGL